MSNLITRLKQRLFTRKDVLSDHHAGEDNPYRDYHPAHQGDTPDDLHRGRHRYKETFTNHWDLDYLSREELEEILAERNGATSGARRKSR
ncbi:hypothetical protein A15D_00333 [Alcanivorax sp. MD8A]|uniref:Uncharacterized protein n=1 Tax=Alcanivorax profundi TaxID=2338368 RepID=A0A418XZ41_9GAMM|nr:MULTISPECIES: hypothetical protein [Alcanivorax]ERP89231.1 hypothetical protein Q670_02325 [Alcanivorax sp. P2S70]PNE04153.1 hypothetical protein A15D_00333 [Alcanivorax sp. MD8A]RJG18286.1 hypothetical protein D4A39_07385 [Alcanivorax profundi]